MRQTNEYGLSQWEKQDRILMEDFNGDNEKVDAALAELAEDVAKKADTDTMRAENLWVKVGEATLTAAGTELAVTVENAERYRCFQLYFSGSGPLDISLGLNDTLGMLTEASSGSSSDTAQFLIGKALIIRGGTMGFLVEGDAKLYDGDYDWGRGDSWTNRSMILSGTVTVKLIGNNKSFGSGSHMVLYGLKA